MAHLNQINDQLLRIGADATRQIDLKAAFGDSYTTFAVTSSDGTAVSAEIVDGVLTLNATGLGFTDLVVTASDASGASVSDNVRVRAAGENAFTVALLPDTQNYTSNASLNHIFGDMTQWLADNADSRNIDFVVGLGDVTDNNNAAQWSIASEALHRLDGKIPYSILPGNHDQASGGSAADHSTTFLDNLFSPDAQAATNPDTFGGVYDREPNRAANSFHTFTAPDGTSWLVLSLEFAPRDDVIRWASDIIEGHLDHRVIIASHTLTTYAGRSDAMAGLIGAAPIQGYGVANSAQGANDGETVYRELTSKYPNVVMTVSGHVLGDSAETNQSYSQHGNTVLEMMADYQNGSTTELSTRGGEGAIRLLIIDPDNGTISTETYFTERDEYLTGYRDKPELDRDGLTGPYRGHQETFTGLDLGAPELVAQAKAGSDLFVEAGDDADSALVTLDGSSLNPSLAASYEWRDADGRVLSTEAVANIELGAGKHVLTLVVTDHDGRVTTDETLVVVSGADTLLVENFNDGNADGWSKPASADAPTLSEELAFGSAEQFGLPAMTGGPSSVMAFPATAPTVEGFLIRPDFGSSAPIKSYTLAMDVLVPVANKSQWFAFLQTDPAQSSSNDADFLINMSGGIGINGSYTGTFQYGIWQRVVLTVTDLGNGNSTLAKYIDGVLVGSQSMATSRYQIDPEKGFLIFSDNAPNGANLQTQSGYVSSVMFSDKPMTAAQVTALGKADADGISAAQPSGGHSVQFDFNTNAPFEPSHGNGQFEVIQPDSIFDATHFGMTEELGAIPLPGGSDEIMEFPATTPDEGYLVKPGFGPANGGPIRSYTIIWDVFAPEAKNHWMALLQTDPANASDADFLVNMAGGIGINGNYTGTFAIDQWQRIALTVRDNGDGTVTLSKYLQGVLVGTQSMPADRYQIDPVKGFLIFTDDAPFQNDHETLHGFANSVFFTDKVMSTAEIGALGGAKAGGIMAEANIDPEHAVQFDFDNGSLDPRFGDGSLTLWDKSHTQNLDGWSVKGTINAPDSDPASGEGALHDRSDAAGKLLVWDSADAVQWSNYSYDVSLKSTDNDDIGVVFYYTDAQNYYRFVMDNEGVSRTLVRVQNGVETVLAQVSAGYRFNDVLDLRVIVSGNRIDILLDGKSVFDGPVTDASPLSGGSVGVYSSGQKSSIFDDITVNKLALTAHGEGDMRAIAEEGHDTALVHLTAESSFGPDAITGYRWLVDGQVVAETRDAAVELTVGTKQVTLEVTDSAGKVSTDIIAVDVVGHGAVLAQDRFNEGPLGSSWTILDEGTIGGPSDWVVENGRLHQKSNIYSEQLTAGGPSNGDPWQMGWSPLGDGTYILRKGTIALYDAPESGASDWKDYSVETSFRTPDDDGLGLVFYYQDPNNYYKLELNHQYQVWTLVRLQDGIEEILGQAWNKYAINQETKLRVDILDHKISAYVDGEALFSYAIEDRGLDGGTFGLYSWGSQGVSFDDVTVVSLADAPETGDIIGTAGDDTLVGTAGADVINGLAGDDVLSGLAGNDTIDGGEGDDTLAGGEGNDTLIAGAGIDDDDLFGGTGDDRLTGNGGDNVLDGGDGLDTADYTADTAGVTVDLAAGTSFGDESGSDELSGIEIVLGGSGNDTLIGDAAANTLNGGAGNDVLAGGAGDDTIIGGEGSDTFVLNGATGAILLDLAAGTASAEGLGSDSFTGIEAFRLGDGDDVATLVAGSGPTGPIDGGAGHDRLVLTGTGTLSALTGIEQLDLQGNWTVTGQGADVAFQDGAQTLAIDSAFTGTISALGQDDRIQLIGFAGSAATLGAGNLLTITGATGTHTLQLDPADDYAGMDFTVESDGLGGSYLAYGPANVGDDVLAGGNGSDVLDGGAGDDTITGGAGNDTLLGGLGQDRVDGGSGDDLVSGGAGNDTLKGGSGIDRIDGGDGNDVIDAGSDADIVLGGAGNDTIKGGSGDDVITGGAGDDMLSGGSGHDSFVFAAGFGHDTVSDFALMGSSSDVIAFDAGIFADFAAVQAHAEQVGHDVVITLDDQHSLTLSNVALAALQADDFRFAA